MFAVYIYCKRYDVTVPKRHKWQRRYWNGFCSISERNPSPSTVMHKRNLMLFEDERICNKATEYTLEYSKRMDLEVYLLMLIKMPFRKHSSLGSKRNRIIDLERRVGRILSSVSNQFVTKGIPVSVFLRVGYPAQELLKFLAERPPFHMIIWASDEALPTQQLLHNKHWIEDVVDELECPLFSVHRKTDTTIDSKLDTE